MLREQTMTEQHGRLGDHKVRRIGYGAMQLAEGTPPPRDDAIAVLRRAVELGVDHIDTAEFYGTASPTTSSGRRSGRTRRTWRGEQGRRGARGQAPSRRSGPSSCARGSRPTCAGSASSGWPP